VAYVAKRLAEAYGISEEEVIRKTDANCKKVLNITV
jgi:TatD DNase family protein